MSRTTLPRFTLLPTYRRFLRPTLVAYVFLLWHFLQSVCISVMSNKLSNVFSASLPLIWSTSSPTHPHIAQSGCSAIQPSLTFFQSRFHSPGTAAQGDSPHPRRALRDTPALHPHASTPRPEGSRAWQWGHRAGGVIGTGGSPDLAGGIAQDPLGSRGGGPRQATG